MVPTMASDSLSEDSVIRAIDTLLVSLPQDGDVRLFRTETPSDWSAVRSVCDPTNLVETGSILSEPDVRTPFYFGIHALSGDVTVVGFCTFYIAYSTWDGRFLYADQIQPESEGGLMLYRFMAQIARAIGCTRLTWKQQDRPEWNLELSDPEYLHDWIFLSMDRSAMANFVGAPAPESSNNEEEERERSLKPMLFLLLEDTIREILEEQSMTHNNITVNLRLAEPDDTDTIAELVQGLAIYEKEPDAVNVTAEDYYTDGFNSSEPLFYCILADVTTHGGDENSSGPTTTTAAMGLFYFGHNLKDGPFLYLEDLFCHEAYRKQGIGTEIMKHLAKISLALDCSKFVWVALDWNTPALTFYKKIGATMQTDLKITRYCGSGIEAFAASGNR